jgi:PHD/YefM family antitoxin component YafN of YafNO toxin-antitoxin module
MPIQEILGTDEARKQLGDVLKRFRRDGADAEPVLFGAHRKPEAVILPVALWERLQLMEEQGKFVSAHHVAEIVNRAGDDKEAPHRRVMRRPRPDRG